MDTDLRRGVAPLSAAGLASCTVVQGFVTPGETITRLPTSRWRSCLRSALMLTGAALRLFPIAQGGSTPASGPARRPGTETVPTLLPAGPKLIQPEGRLTQGLTSDGIEPTGSLRPDRREAGLPEHAQMLGDSGLADPEFMLDHRADRARGLFAGGEQLQYSAPYRIAQDIEGLHGVTLHSLLI